MRICIERIRTNEKQTEGKLYVYTSKGELIFNALTIELPWRHNRRRIPCIPAGEYPATLHTSPKFGSCIWIKNVPDRSEILIHKGNYHHDTLGCILTGKDFLDIDGDGNKDVTNSAKTVKAMIKAIKDKMEPGEQLKVKVEWINIDI